MLLNIVEIWGCGNTQNTGSKHRFQVESGGGGEKIQTDQWVRGDSVGSNFIFKFLYMYINSSKQTSPSFRDLKSTIIK